MRGDPEHKPVEWHWFRGAKDRQVVFVDSRNDIRACFADGRYWPEGQHNLDLIPIPSPPQIVPWESLREIPVGIWIRHKNMNVARQIAEYDYESNYVRVLGACESLSSLHAGCEWHTNPHADDGWQPCGKVVK